MRRMLPDGRRLGAHLPLGDGMVRAVERAHEIGATAIQIFTDNPTAWRRRAEPPRELEAFRARLEALDVGPVAIHAAYLVNLAGPDPEHYERSIGLLVTELGGAPSFRGRYVNAHIGSHRGTGVETGIERLADGVAAVFAGVDRARREPDEVRPARAIAAQEPMLVLENSAGSGWGLGVDIDELAAIDEAIRARGVADERVGFCLDTAHAWAAGIDVSSPAEIDAFLDDFDRQIGVERLVMVHLNDAQTERGSRHDRHEHIGAGRIGPVGLGHLLRHPRLAHTTFYLETPGMDSGYDAVNIARARAMAAGEPLPPLPAAAFELDASPRSRSAPA